MHHHLKILILFLTFLCFPTSAGASFWVKCEVTADIVESFASGKYNAKIISAEIVGGHSEKGSPCMQGNIGKTIEIYINGKVLPGKKNVLEYEFFNGRASGGVVNEESWKVKKSLIQRIFSSN